MTTYTIIDADGDTTIVRGTKEEAIARAQRYSDGWDIDCHIEDSKGEVVATFGR